MLVTFSFVTVACEPTGGVSKVIPRTSADGSTPLVMGSIVMKAHFVIRSLVIVILGIAVIGCSGSGSPFPYVPVSGKVTYEDGSPLPVSGMILNFYALDAPAIEGATPRPAQAEVNSQGDFSHATSYKYADGLIPGRHRVAFFYATDSDGNLAVPVEFTQPNDSPAIVDTAELPLVIQVPKP